MIRTTLNVTDHFTEITRELELRVVDAVNRAAIAAALEADKVANQPKPIARFTFLPARNIGSGYAAGVKAGPLVQIFDRGSLGRHTGALKRHGSPDWQVNRGANPYTAHRHEDLSGKGIAPRRILNAARAAARTTLRRRLLSR